MTDFAELLMQAARGLEGSGRPELADGLWFAFRRWWVRRASVGESGAVEVRDDDWLLERHPGLARGIRGWLLGPGPRLPGLELSVREWIRGEEPPRAEIRMDWDGGGIERVLDPGQGRGYESPEDVSRVLGSMHRELVRRSPRRTDGHFVTGLTEAGPVVRTAPDPLG